ncbi:MAG: sensor histidine kinase [Actinomycetes bacterium]
MTPSLVLTRTAPWLLCAAGVVLGLVGEHEQRESLQPWSFVIADLLGGWAFLAAGLVVRARRPHNRCWWLLMATGLTWFVGTFQAASNENVSLAGFAFMGWYDLFLVWLLLAFPTGRLVSTNDRLLVSALAALFAFRSLSRLFLFVPWDGTGCGCVTNRFIPVSDRRWFDTVESAFPWGLAAVLLLALASVVVRHRRSSLPGRQTLAPVLVAGAALAAGVAYDQVVEPFATVGSLTQRHAGFMAGYVAIRVLAGVAIVVGLLRLHAARSAVADLVTDLGDDAPPAELGAALRRALGDPSLVLYPWSPAAGGYLDEGGSPAQVPAATGARAVTFIEQSGTPIAALHHDATLSEDPGLVRAVVAAVRLTSDNERLRTEIQSQLAEVAASRARIVAAGDAERRRMERDLHDGAQQRLVTVALALRLTELRLGQGADPQVRTDLSQAVKELGQAIDDLRDLARGIHPAILTEAGLAAAIESLADRSPVPVRLDVDLDREPPATVAAAAYFAVAEALTNVAKHASAEHAGITLAQSDGALHVAVTDDGRGGAEAAGGTGLRGIADRVAAAGGSVEVHSPVGGGTLVRLRLPCG